jgi:magnesium-protoporphyrin O-methyltransferase
VQDLETLSGKYHTVICLDVLIHYPQDKAAEMISHLCSMAESRIILSFAPKTLALSLLKKIGSFFPGPSKATRAYLHREADVVKILESNGFVIQRKAMTKTRFYFSRLLEATRS